MTGADPDLEDAINEFHEEIPHQFQVSLTMSIETRDLLTEIRERLNEHVGERIFTTNDSIRLALLCASRYSAINEGDPEEVDRELLLPLAKSIEDAIDEDQFPQAYRNVDK